MDNLIRARLNRPFVQLQYRDLLVQHLDVLLAEGSAMQTVTDTSGIDGGMLSMLRVIATPLNVGGKASQEVILSFKADPVTNQDDVYDKYIAFATNPFYFQVCDKQPEFPVHIWCFHEGLYYYVPVEAAYAFQQMVLETTFKRAPKKDSLENVFVRRTISRVVKLESMDGALEIYHVFFNQPVTNSEAFGFIEIHEKRVRLDLLPVDESAVSTDKTWFLSYHHDPGSPFDIIDLKGKDTLLVLVDVPPGTEEIPTGPAQRVIDSLNRIEANVLSERR